MTLESYRAIITDIIDQQTAGSFPYPEDFDAQTEQFARNQLSVEEAAEALIAVPADKTVG